MMFPNSLHKEVIIELSHRDISYILRILYVELVRLKDEEIETDLSSRIRVVTVANIMDAFRFMLDNNTDIFPQDVTFQDDPLSGTESHTVTIWLTEHQICTLADFIENDIDAHARLVLNENEQDLIIEVAFQMATGQGLYDRLYPYYVNSMETT